MNSGEKDKIFIGVYDSLHCMLYFVDDTIPSEIIEEIMKGIAENIVYRVEKIIGKQDIL